MSETKLITVIIVDDHEITRLGLKATLHNLGDFHVLAEAENGSQAATLVEQFKPDVVLMDIAMPVMDGIEASRLIKSANPDVKILMFTSHDDDSDVFAALSAGADGYCLKDSSIDLVAQAIRAVCMGAAWLDSGIAKIVLQTERTERASASEPKFNLSLRELEVLGVLVEGASNQQIATKLIISTETVKTHMRHIMEKLMVSDRTQAAVKAVKQGLLSKLKTDQCQTGTA